MSLHGVIRPIRFCRSLLSRTHHKSATLHTYNYNTYNTTAIPQYNTIQYRSFASDAANNDNIEAKTDDATDVDTEEVLEETLDLNNLDLTPEELAEARSDDTTDDVDAKSDRKRIPQQPRPNPATDGASQWLKPVPRLKGKPRLQFPVDKHVYDVNLEQSEIEKQIDQKYQKRLTHETEYQVSKRIYNDKLYQYRLYYRDIIQQAQSDRQRLLLQKHSELNEYRRMKALRLEYRRQRKAQEHKQHMTEIAQKTAEKQKHAAENLQRYKNRLNDRRIYGFMNYVLTNEYKQTSILQSNDLNENIFKNEKVVMGWFPPINNEEDYEDDQPQQQS